MTSPVGPNAVASLYATRQIATASQTAATNTGVAIQLNGDRADISGPGQLLAQLFALQSTDPAKFKQVAASISTALQTVAASQTTDTTANQFLTSLADQFQTVATTGDLSALLPATHGQHHLHPQGTYNQLGQAAPVLLDPNANNNTNLAQIVQNIVQQVSQAFAA